MIDPANDLQETIESAMAQLQSIGETESAERRDNAWSRKEIIGHLIDSATNNHRRFILAQLQDDLIFPTYAQEHWVSLQQYQQVPWSNLLQLWQAYNQHLAHVIAVIPAAERQRARPRHNLHEIGWRTVTAEETVTLEDLIVDYVGHLKHHLRQIFQYDGAADKA